MLGTIANVTTIAAGSLVGMVVRKGVPEQAQQTLMHGLGLAVLLIGFQMALKTENPLIVIGSIVLGAISGEIINIEARLEGLGTKLETRFAGSEANLTRAFVTASLVFCVGAMAVTGSLEDGIAGKTSILFAKAIIDGIAAAVFASTMGVGVILSTIPVFLYQGTITLTAHSLVNLLTPHVVAELTATGGLLVIGSGINLLGLTRIRLGNLLPSIVFAVAIASLAG